MTEITKKILIINELLLPNELIDIIKNYAFYDIIKETKKRKNKIISLFNNNIYYNKYEWLINPDFPYPIIFIYNKETNIRWCFMLTYCETCGKYVRITERIITYIDKNLHCNC